MTPPHVKVVEDLNGALPPEHRLSDAELDGLKSDAYFRAHTAITLKRLITGMENVESLVIAHETHIGKLSTHKNVQYAVIIIILGILLSGQ